MGRVVESWQASSGFSGLERLGEEGFGVSGSDWSSVFLVLEVYRVEVEVDGLRNFGLRVCVE